MEWVIWAWHGKKDNVKSLIEEGSRIQKNWKSQQLNASSFESSEIGTPLLLGFASKPTNSVSDSA